MMKKKYSAVIEKLSHEGRGIATINGKTTFIRGALPGEEILFTYRRQHPQYDEGDLTQVVKHSEDRISPRCSHFGLCGGCSFQHVNNNFQIHHKENVLLEQLKHIAKLQPKNVLTPLTAEQWAYRHKARLGIKYVSAKKRVLLGFRETNGRFITDMDHCPILESRFEKQLLSFNSILNQISIKNKIPQVELAVGEKAVALIIRHLVPLSDHDRDLFSQFGKDSQFHIYLQPKGLDTIHRLYPDEKTELLTYSHPDFALEYLFYPTDFTQVNPSINRKMISQTITLLEPNSKETILDLFCGLGNFSLALARFAKTVIGIEGTQTMVKRAYQNAKHNQLSNVDFYAADLFAENQTGKWYQQTFDKILLDPPRAGALTICQNIDRFHAKRILYVSCNPATLARDARELAERGYHLLQCGVMDMFPQTSHVEAMALFIKDDV